MPGGLFELRKDAITGWWVAVVVDRAYDPARFARAAEPVPGGRCFNCSDPPGGGVRVRLLKAHAFRVAGVESRPAGETHATRASGFDAHPEAEAQLRIEGSPRGAATGPAVADHQQGLGLVGDVGSWQTIVAPPDHHRALADEEPGVVVEMLRLARDAIGGARAGGGTAYLQVLQNWGLQAGAFTNHLCLDFYDLPQIPHRVGEELGGAARYLIREGVCPYCRLMRDELASGERVVFEDTASVAFAPYASRSPFEIWVVPRQHQADFGRASEAQLTSAAETLRKVLRLLDALDGPPYNLILHTAPLHERVDDTYHWHWEVHPRLRAIAGLELGTGLPVNPISPEEAVEELRAFANRALGRDRVVEPA